MLITVNARTDYKGTYRFLFEDSDLANYPVYLNAVAWQKAGSAPYTFIGNHRKDAKILFKYTLSGRGAVRIGEQRYDLTPGKAFFVKIPSDHHYFLPKDSDHWEYVYLAWTEAQNDAYFEQIAAKGGQLFDLTLEHPLIRLLLSIHRKASQHEIRDIYTAAHVAFEFVMKLLQHCHRHQAEQRELTPSIQSAMEYMENNYSTADLDEIALSVRLTKFHLIRLYQKETGLTPHQHLTNIRMKKAMGLLAGTRLTLNEIAKQTGYAQANYLCRVFQKQFGITPGQLRADLKRP
jgi:AraC-like DNA-binding protein